MNHLIEVLPVIASLVIMEGLLSVDNAMIIAAMVSHLPEKQQKVARMWGLGGAYVLRILALLAASFLIANPWVKLLGAGYLVYLMCKHLGVAEEGEEGAAKKASQAGMLGTIIQLQFVDLSFSVDNVIAAVALSREYWVVVTGVCIGMLAMFFVAGAFIKLMKKYPVLEPTAYLLVGYVGIQLFLEEMYHFHVTTLFKFSMIMGIMALALAYDRIKPLQKVLGPLVRWVGQGMGNVAELIDWAFVPVTALVGLAKRLFARNKNKPA